MSNNNSIKLVGNLVGDPEFKTNKDNGKEFAVFRLGVNKSFVKEGSEETADFFRCIVGGKLVDELKVLKKGAFVQVEGEMGTRKYDKDSWLRMASIDTSVIRVIPGSYWVFWVQYCFFARHFLPPCL